MVGKAWFVFDCSFVLLCGGGSLFAFVPLGTLGSVLEPYYRLRASADTFKNPRANFFFEFALWRCSVFDTKNCFSPTMA